MPNLLTDKRSGPLFNPAVHMLVIVLLGLLVYSNTFNAAFTFDDWLHFRQNILTKEMKYFITPSLVDSSGLDTMTVTAFKTRTVTYFTFFLNHITGGDAVTGYHIVNISIHLVTALLMYWLFHLLLRTPFFVSRPGIDRERSGLFALCAGILFVCHPVETQAVTYISQRFASLAAMFYLLTTALYILSRRESEKWKRGTLYALSVITALLAMKTKETALTLPVMLTICEIMFFNRLTRQRVLCLMPYYAATMTVLFAMTSVYGPFNDWDELIKATRVYNASTTGRWEYFITQFRVIVTYMRLLIFPVEQNLDYQYPVYSSFADPAMIASFLLLSGICAAALYLYNRSKTGSLYLRLISFGILWFFITLSVESSIIPLDDVIFEHRLYLPSAGFFILIAALMMMVADSHPRLIPAMATACAVAVIGLSIATYIRNGLWKDGIAIWEDTIKKSPGKARGYVNVGVTCFYTNPDKALAYFLKAYKIAPAYQVNLINLGTLYFLKKDYSASIYYYKAAVSLDSPVNDYNVTSSLLNMGYIAFVSGDPEEAKRYFSALIKTPFPIVRSQAIYDLALTYEHLKENRDALCNYELFLELAVPETRHLVPKVNKAVLRLRKAIQ